MPQYFFNTRDGVREKDELGQELPDIAAARAYAVGFVGELLTTERGLLSEAEDFHVEVVDERGLIQFVITVMMNSAPVLSHP